jgi:CelD/BcsL family acetyltransferase involved in cellulose biosynthesis
MAFDFAIEEDGRHYLLKTGFDPAYRALSPGMLLRLEMIERAFALGLRSYEFLGADEPWKLDWTRSLREHVELKAFAPSAAGVVDWAANRYVRPMAVRALSRLGR